MNVFFVSLGCDKNLVDSERMIGQLSRAGMQITDFEDEADIIVVNTCCFIGDAKEESINTILEMAELRREGNCKALIVTGCLAQRYRQEIIDEIPEVDAVLGTGSFDKLEEAINQTLRGQGHSLVMEAPERNARLSGRRVLTTGGHYAYLKIAEGCNRHCTYCIIPKVRGEYRSYPMEELVAEARELVEGGASELILVAQETTLYGTDLYGRKALHELIHELAGIEELKWIRVMYCYPEEIYDGLIEAMKTEPKLCHYLDLPIQHCSDGILGRMGRKTSRAQLEETVARLRREVPDIVLRTTLITGFPGETPEQHEELKSFVEKMRFNRLGVFKYSPEEDTPAAVMPDQIDEEVKQERFDELMTIQQEVSFQRGEEMVGRELEVFVEGKISREETYVCRTYADAPGIDGYLFLETPETFVSGEFARVRVTGASEYDLTGELVEPAEN